MSIDFIVKNNFCTGCGACISEDDSKQAKMVWSDDGFLVPQLGMASTQEKMIKVCPFYINQKNEDELGELFLKKNSNQYNEKIGYYTNLYAGYAKKFRETSSSGGIATYVFKVLLEQKIVDHLFIVSEKNGKYSYQIFSDFNDITKISKTRYMPVTMAELFDKISTIEGRVAVSGVACFVKAIRLKQYYYPELKEKIPFVVGIICGGLKSKYYTDFLAQSAGCFSEYKYVQYRVKNKDSYALDYKFSCVGNNKKIHMVDMQTLGDMWGTGLFKSNACDFCDDVVTELADISLGDAWISPYDKSGLGNSIIITRTKVADDIIQTGLINNELYLDSLGEDCIIQSQAGSYNHRQKGLFFRVTYFEKHNLAFPVKRNRFFQRQSLFFNLVQQQRLETRAKSIEYWREFRNIKKFKSKIQYSLSKLDFFTKINHRYLRIQKIVKGIMLK